MRVPDAPISGGVSTNANPGKSVQFCVQAKRREWAGGVMTTKDELLTTLLLRPEGVTAEEARTALRWLAISIPLNAKRLGLRLEVIGQTPSGRGKRYRGFRPTITIRERAKHEIVTSPSAEQVSEPDLFSSYQGRFATTCRKHVGEAIVEARNKRRTAQSEHAGTAARMSIEAICEANDFKLNSERDHRIARCKHCWMGYRILRGRRNIRGIVHRIERHALKHRRQAERASRALELAQRSAA
jgi:hypothetical protein